MFSFWLNVLLSGYYGEQMCGGSLILFSFFGGGGERKEVLERAGERKHQSIQSMANPL